MKMNVLPQDEVLCTVKVKVAEVIHKVDPKTSLLWGHTPDGVYVCLPLSTIISEPDDVTLGNGGEPIPAEINEDDPREER